MKIEPGCSYIIRTMDEARLFLSEIKELMPTVDQLLLQNLEETFEQGEYVRADLLTTGGIGISSVTAGGPYFMSNDSKQKLRMQWITPEMLEYQPPWAIPISTKTENDRAAAWLLMLTSKERCRKMVRRHVEAYAYGALVMEYDNDPWFISPYMSDKARKSFFKDYKYKVFSLESLAIADEAVEAVNGLYLDRKPASVAPSVPALDPPVTVEGDPVEGAYSSPTPDPCPNMTRDDVQSSSKFRIADTGPFIIFTRSSEEVNLVLAWLDENFKRGDIWWKQHGADVPKRGVADVPVMFRPKNCAYIAAEKDGRLRYDQGRGYVVGWGNALGQVERDDGVVVARDMPLIREGESVDTYNIFKRLDWAFKAGILCETQPEPVSEPVSEDPAVVEDKDTETLEELLVPLFKALLGKLEK